MQVTNYEIVFRISNLFLLYFLVADILLFSPCLLFIFVKH